jgi:hypothetical protein
MPDPRLRFHDLKRRADALATSIEKVLAWNEAVGLAFEERTGKPLGDGEPYTPEDAKRADEIILLFSKVGV